MRLEISTLKRTISALGLSALLLVATGSTAFAHRTGRRHNHGRHLGWVRRDANRDTRLHKHALKTHQKAERRTLKQHQKAERRDVRDDASGRDRGDALRVLGQHQRQERQEMHTHQRQERETFRSNNGRGRGRP